jgi:hypothetical protein
MKYRLRTPVRPTIPPESVPGPVFRISTDDMTGSTKLGR